MKTVVIKYAKYDVLASMETDKSILLLVKRPAGKKMWLAYQYPNGMVKLRGEMPHQTNIDNVWSK